MKYFRLGNFIVENDFFLAYGSKIQDQELASSNDFLAFRAVGWCIAVIWQETGVHLCAFSEFFFS